MTRNSVSDPPTEFGPHTYRRWRESELGQLTEEIEDSLLFDLIGDPEAQDVLDVGCGEGALSLELWQQGAKVIGIDPAEEMITAARKRAESAGAEIRFLRAQAEDMPFKEAQFDRVVAKTILCFVEDPTDVFAEMARVLRPGGCLVIGELGKWSPWALQRFIRGKFGSPLWRHGHFWTATDLRRLATTAGLSVREVRGAVYYPRLGLAARLFRPFDARLGRITTIGAAFIAMAAAKPSSSQTINRSDARPTR